MHLTDKDIEAKIKANGLTAARVTQADVEASILGEFFFTAMDGMRGVLDGMNPAVDEIEKKALPHVTLCVLVLKNGHKIVGVNTGPVSPENFDAEFARELARKNAIDQVWPLLGYALRERLQAKTDLTPDTKSSAQS